MESVELRYCTGGSRYKAYWQKARLPEWARTGGRRPAHAQVSPPTSKTVLAAHGQALCVTAVGT
jgi:hypothetical protein